MSEAFELISLLDKKNINLKPMPLGIDKKKVLKNKIGEFYKLATKYSLEYDLSLLNNIPKLLPVKAKEFATFAQKKEIQIILDIHADILNMPKKRKAILRPKIEEILFILFKFSFQKLDGMLNNLGKHTATIVKQLSGLDKEKMYEVLSLLNIYNLSKNINWLLVICVDVFSMTITTGEIPSDIRQEIQGASSISSIVRAIQKLETKYKNMLTQ